jgi:hypothetical protein
LTKATGLAYGVRPEDRTDPYKNIDASLAYMRDLNKKYQDPQKVAVGYNQGETVLNRHLAENNGQLNTATLPTEAQSYLKKLGTKLTNALPISSAVAAPAPAPVAAATTSEAGLASLIPTGGDQAPAGVYGWNQPDGKQGAIASTIEDVGNWLGNTAKLPAFIPAVGVAGQGVAELNAANRAATGAERSATAAAEAVKNVRLPAPATNVMDRIRQGLAGINALNEDKAAATNIANAAAKAKIAESEAAALANTAAEGTQYANQVAQRAGTVRNAVVASGIAAGSANGPSPAPVPPEVKPFKQDIADTVKNSLSEDAKSGLKFSNEDYLRLGLGLLAGNVKGATFGQALGEAGLGVLQNRQLQQQLATKTELEKAQAEMYRQHAAMFGAKPSMAAQALAQKNYAEWYKINGMGTTEQQQMDAMNRFLSAAMAAEQGPQIASTAPAVPQGVKVSQIG